MSHNLSSLTFKTFASLDRRTMAGICALLLGQILFLINFGVVYIAALVYLLAVGLPYPKIFQSWLSRLVVGFLLALSIIQVAATFQFFIAPNSKFAVLSLFTTALCICLVLTLRKVPRRPWVFGTKEDVAGTVTALFFVLPLSVLCFWQNDPVHITAFVSVQGVDGSNHYTAMAEMSKEQHLNYQTVEYYPKGFHVASALLLSGIHANQADQTWTANAQTYISMFIAWGALLAYLVSYLAMQFTKKLRKQPAPLLIALSIGPLLTLLYLFTFAQEGFLNYYYIGAAFICAIMYLYDIKFDKRVHQWPIVAYLLLSFGIAMSWGPLLTPLLLAIPILYLWPQLQNVRTLPRLLISKEWRWITLAFILQIIPLYLHLKYAHLTSEQGLNATGALRVFHYGPFLAGLGLTIYLVCGRVNDELRKFAGNVLLPFFILVGAFSCFQYMTVGELRYYAIKSSLLLEIILLATVVAVLGAALYQSKAAAIHRWLLLPTAIGLGGVMLTGVTANPFSQASTSLGTLFHNVRTVDPTIRNLTTLGQSGKLSTNISHLHYEKATNKLVGNAPIVNWATLMQYAADGSPASGACAGRIFALEAYGLGTTQEQDQLVAALKECAQAAAERHHPYFIVTDATSIPHLREIFSNGMTYIY
jgi:hypothetical protein